MTTLHLPPDTKQLIRDSLQGFLYAATERHFKGVLAALVYRNCQLVNNRNPQISYRGEVYTSNPNLTPPKRLNRLAPELVPEFQEYLAEVKEIENQEKPVIMGFITQTLNSSNTLKDYLRVLPESVHRAIRDYIGNFPEQLPELTDEQVIALQTHNAQAIQLIKARMMLNLLY